MNLEEIKFWSTQPENRQSPEVGSEERFEGLKESMFHARNRLLFFILFAIYCLLAIFGTTDRMIFMEQGIGMPLLNIELPLIAFYLTMPVFLIALQFNLLYTYRTHKQLLLEERNEHGDVLLKKLPFGLYEGVLLQCNGHLGRVMYGAMLGIFYLLPSLVLTAFWFRFADYQNLPITTFHLALLVVSLLVPAFFFRRLLQQEASLWKWLMEKWSHRVRFGITWILISLFAGLIGSYYGLVVVPIAQEEIKNFQSLEKFVEKDGWEEKVNQVFSWIPGDRWFLPRLTMEGETLVEIDKHVLEVLREAKDGVKKEWAWKTELIRSLPPTDYSNRNFRLAEITNSLLPRVNLSGSEFQNANLQGSTFHDANLLNASLQVADLLDTSWKDADLCDVKVEGAKSISQEQGEWGKCKRKIVRLVKQVSKGERVFPQGHFQEERVASKVREENQITSVLENHPTEKYALLAGCYKEDVSKDEILFWPHIERTQKPCAGEQQLSNIQHDQYGTYADVELKTNAEPVTQRFRWIEPGTFMMGSPESEEGRDNDEVHHQVTLTKGYWMADTETTQQLWQAVMNTNPSQFKGENRPVEKVSWNDVQGFLKKLKQFNPGFNAKLPTEAQWEYATRAGTNTAIYTGDLKILGRRNAPALDEIAWYGGNSGIDFELENGWDASEWSEKQYEFDKAGTHPVGLKKPNGWGLYDTLGNVWEWTRDHWQEKLPAEPVSDPLVESGSDLRVIRGGSWLNLGRSVRSAYRSSYGADGRYGILGFRISLGH